MLRKGIQDMVSVAIVGAGAAGLAMARYLSANQELYKFVVYEQGREEGGTWIYEENDGKGALIDTNTLKHQELKILVEQDKIHSSMYKNLRANLPKQVMEYPDFPFAKECRTFPTHNDVLEYLKAYCTNFDLKQFIKFKTKVKLISPLVDASSNKKGDLNMKWKVTTIDENDCEKTQIFDSVVICNGHFSTPNLPEIPNIDIFPGSVTHSHFYRVPDPYKDKVVIVLGGRASGRDIAVEISQLAKTVILSHRDMHGKCQLRDNIIEKTSIKCINDNGDVIFEDGSKCSANAIIYCTGYLFNFSFLDQSCGIEVKNGRIAPLFKHIFNACYPSMAIMGVCNIVCPFKLFSMQAQWISNVLSRKVALPSFEEMQADHDKELERRLTAGIPERHFHRLPDDFQWEYYKIIADFGKVEPIKNVIQKLYKTVAKDRGINLLSYREKEYVVVDDEKFEMYD